MRIGINCQTILNPGYGEQAGVGHYTYYLVKNLLKLDKKNEYVLFFDSLITNEAVKNIIAGNKNTTVRFFPFYGYKKYLPFAYSHMLIAGILKREKLDVYHAPANILPLSYKGRSVVTVHDLAVYKHPEWFPQKFFSKHISTKLLVPQSLNKADKIIAVSQSTKKDIIKLFKTPAKKIEVIYEGVKMKDLPDFGKVVCGLEDVRCREQLFKRYNLNKKYILFLGTIEPRKNLSASIRAFGEAMKDNKKLANDYKFAIAGARGWKFQEVFKTLNKVNKELRGLYPDRGDFIKYLGYVSHHDKLALMGNAACFIFPSLYEGFGLPALEAMSLGTPVITSKVSSLPEVAGAAALLINPNKEKEIAAALGKVLKSTALRKKMREAGRKRAKEFSWQRTAKETLEVYKKPA